MLKKQFLSLVIRYAGKFLAVCLFLTLFAGDVFAASNFDWVGTVSNDWATPQNWRRNNANQNAFGSYPGQVVNDVVRIGVNNNFTTANSPVLSTALTKTIGSIEFGDNNGVAMSLTINTGFTLTVTGNIKQDHNAVAGGITTNITGAGTLACQGDFDLGDTTTPASGTAGAYSTAINSDINSLTITGSLVLTDTRSGTTRFNNPLFNLTGGSLNVADIETNDNNFRTGNACTFKMDIGTNPNTLTLTGTTLFSNLSSSNTVIDFVSGGTVSASTVVYGAPTGTQNVYTNTDGTNDGINITPTMYPNLTFSGGNKSVRTGTLSIGGDWKTGGGTINLVATGTDPTVTVGGDWNNSANVTLGTSAITITGDLNNTSNTITGNATATTLTVAGALVNGGTIAVGSDAMTFALASTNTGTYTGGAGASKFTAGLTNTGTVNEGAGTFTIGNLINNSGGTLIGYNTATAATNITGTLSNAGTITANKENITCTGAATNTNTFTGGTGNSTFNGTFTMTAGSFATGTGDVTFGNNYSCSGGTFTGSTGDVIFKGGYSNTGTGVFNAPTTGDIILSGTGNQTLTDNSASGTTLKNAQFQGGGTKTLAGTKGFFLASNGVLTLSASTTLACGGVLTLNSDVSSSATIAAIPAGSSITGTINVQRFIQGNLDITKRGYRLVSSTVWTFNDGTSNIFDLNYLKNNTIVSGPGGVSNGFDATPTQNPSIYLFREDDPPPPSNSTSFTTGYNWKGIAKINNPNAYDIGTQTKTQTRNVLDTTVHIPVGNGLLFFFRGNTNLSNGTSAGTKTTDPVNSPEDVTFTETGNLNTGTINVRLWYATSALLGNNLSYTSVNTAASSLTAGFNLVANPYPSTINWEKFNRNTTKANSSIYGSNSLPSIIWVFNQQNKQYESYKQKTTITSTADTTTSINPGIASGTAASNMIASGQAFFIVANSKNQSLSFRETAKTNTQPTVTKLNKLLGKPKEMVAQPEPVMHLQLKMDSVNTDGIAISLGNNASTKYDINEDARDLGGDGALVSLSSLSSDSVALSINYTPFPGKQQQVIPLLANATASGAYQLTLTDLTNLPKLYTVWLKDAFTADSLEMKANITYPFTIDKSNAATFGRKRLSLVIRQDSAYAYKLLDFSAEKTNRRTDVQLVWKTENEENYTRFTVERSTNNGRSFDVIGSQTGTGVGNYSLVDKNPDKGQNLYRLKQVDLNNTVTYSKLIQVQFSDRGNSSVWDRLRIYPNPASHNINLAINDQYAENASYTIRFVNSYGMVIKQINCTDAEWHGNVSNLRPGTYLVRVFNNRNQKLVGENKFVKL